MGFALNTIVFTRSILTLHGEEVEETDIPGFQSDKQTFFCGNVNNELIIQVTSFNARLISTQKKALLRYVTRLSFRCLIVPSDSNLACVNSEWKPSGEKTISVVACNGSQIVCAAGSELYYLELIMDEIVLKK